MILCFFLAGTRDTPATVHRGVTGYTESVAREVREKLDPLIVRKSPLTVPVKKPKATWVKPIVDAEIEYAGITDDGLLRSAVFKGLREDLGPTCAPPAPAKRTS